jgi:hypothetical protein
VGLIETREKTLLPDAAHDELGVLRAEIDDGDVLGIHRRKGKGFKVQGVGIERVELGRRFL